MNFEDDSEIAVSLTALLCFAMSRKFVNGDLREAVVSLNKKDGYNRRFILVEMMDYLMLFMKECGIAKS